MYLLDSLFTKADFLAVPICFIMLMMVMSVVVNKYKDDRTRRLFMRAFYVKMGFSLAYTVLNTFYYRGGDTEMYYFASQYLKDAVDADFSNFWTIYTTKVINVKTSLMEFFIYKETGYPTFEAMHNSGNFLVPKLALPSMLIFANSYLCTAMVFSFFSLGGCIRLYKVFVHYYPDYWREIALATLFIPSACFWSAGVMKDPICFGCVGYITYGMFSMFVKRRNYVVSIALIVICSVLLYHMKVYILLALAPSIVLWLFTQFSRLVQNKTLRNIMAGLTFLIGATLGFAMINYVTSDESMQQFRLDSITESSEKQRELYEDFGSKYEGSYYSIQTSNPVLLVLNGIVAALFRPFPWEVNGPTAALSSLESLFFLFITVVLVYRRGFFNFFRNAFRQPVLLMCFVFSFVFAAAVGSTALNFGSVSRYKIPCLPFYLTMILVLYRQANLAYPNWFKKLLGYKVMTPREISALKMQKRAQKKAVV